MDSHEIKSFVAALAIFAVVVAFKTGLAWLLFSLLALWLFEAWQRPPLPVEEKPSAPIHVEVKNGKARRQIGPNCLCYTDHLLDSSEYSTLTPFEEWKASQSPAVQKVLTPQSLVDKLRKSRYYRSDN